MNSYFITANNTSNKDCQSSEDVTMEDEVPTQNPIASDPNTNIYSQTGM